MEKNRKEQLQAFERILDVMDELRENCPWDKKQTMQSLRNLTIEETYELADAILDNDTNGIKEELGDILLHIVFYSRIAAENNYFDIADVIHAECEKLISRHPHIYGDVKVTGEEEVKQNWERLKKKEGKRSLLEGVPNSLPAMVKAYRMQEKTKQVGFEWEHVDQVWEKVQEELQELNEIKDDPNTDHGRIEDEMGDVIFALINYARFLKVDPETALEKTNRKFKKRFQYIEGIAEQKGKLLEEMTLEEMDAIWNEAKNESRK